MAELSRETIEEFRVIFKKEYGVEYTDQEAWEATHNLIGFFDLLLKIDHRQKQRLNDSKSDT
ncbi:MAG: hypothetical protein AAB922_01930 [Patescibacteria group bacterium]